MMWMHVRGFGIVPAGFSATVRNHASGRGVASGARGGGARFEGHQIDVTEFRHSTGQDRGGQAVNNGLSERCYC